MQRFSVKWMGVGILITPICVIIAMIFAGGGDGTYLFFKLFFPYTMLLAALANGISIPLMILGLLQFPLYGVLIGFARSKEASAAIIWLLVVHTIAVILCFLFLDSNWR